MRTIAIIQTRMGSSRLPGKVLRDLAGDTMLARVVQRVRAARSISQIVIATTHRLHRDTARLGKKLERELRIHSLLLHHVRTRGV